MNQNKMALRKAIIEMIVLMLICLGITYITYLIINKTFPVESICLSLIISECTFRICDYVSNLKYNKRTRSNE